jgi:4-amino-4-deoxy-L-arabinose transferase-like glycosyltransferase
MPDAPEQRGWWDRRYTLAVLIGVLALVYLANIGQYGFIGADEPRYVRIAEEMAWRGDPVVPTYRGTAWLEKPPLLYWLVGASLRVFGVSEFSARVPSVLAALALVAALFLAVRPVYGARLAGHAALVLATSALYIGYAGAATTDILLAATTGGGLLLLWRYLSADEIPPAGWLYGAAALFGLGCLAKGPLALVLPVLAVYPFIALTGRMQGLTLGRLAVAGVVFLAVAVPWHVAIYQREGFKFVLVYFINHHLARYVTDIHHHTRPFWFFVPVLLLGALPWTAFLMFLRRLPEVFRARRTDPRAAGFIFFACWLVAPLVFFSLGKAKLPGYVLPLFPALAFLIAWGIEGLITDGAGRVRLMKWMLFGSAAVLLVAVPIVFQFRFARPGLGLLLDALILPGLLLAGVLLQRNRRALVASAVALAVLLPLVAGTPWVVPVLEPYFSHRRLCREAMRWTGPADPLVIYRNFHYTNDYYTDYTCTDNLPGPPDLARYLERRRGTVYVLTTREAAPDLTGLTGWRWTELDAAGGTVLGKLEPPS